MVKRNEIEIRLETCNECADKPLVIAGYYRGERYYGRDIRPEEYEDLYYIVDEVKDTVLDMVEE